MLRFHPANMITPTGGTLKRTDSWSTSPIKIRNSHSHFPLPVWITRVKFIGCRLGIPSYLWILRHFGVSDKQTNILGKPPVLSSLMKPRSEHPPKTIQSYQKCPKMGWRTFFNQPQPILNHSFWCSSTCMGPLAKVVGAYPQLLELGISQLQPLITIWMLRSSSHLVTNPFCGLYLSFLSGLILLIPTNLRYNPQKPFGMSH
jgi:hypothetical protein